MRKTLDEARAVAQEPGSRLRSELNVFELTSIGLAVVVGAGIFTAAPAVYRSDTGPWVVLSILVAAVPCVLVALCYAECSTRIPVAGSVYTFAYVAFGRWVAWVVAWLLVLEYTVGAAFVARSWSQYMSTLLGEVGLVIRPARDPLDWVAVLVVTLLVVVLLGGVKVASRFTMVATAVKVLVLLLIVAVGATKFTGGNFFDNALPVDHPPPQPPGVRTAEPVMGTLTAAATLFYAFIGFDSVSTVAEEARRPRRDLARAILWSLAIATVLYAAVAVMMVGLVKATAVPAQEPTIQTLLAASGLSFASTIVTIGALIGLTTGILVLLLGQSRIALAMARDGFVPKALARLGPRRTPSALVLTAGGICATIAVAAVIPSYTLLAVVNVGTLLLFVVVCAIAVRLHSDSYIPGERATFRVPWVWWVGGAGVLSCAVLIFLTFYNASMALLGFFAGYVAVALLGLFIVVRRRRTEAVRRQWGSRWTGSWRWHDDERTPLRDLIRSHIADAAPQGQRLADVEPDDPPNSAGRVRSDGTETVTPHRRRPLLALQQLVLGRRPAIILSPELAGHLFGEPSPVGLPGSWHAWLTARYLAVTSRTAEALRATPGRPWTDARLDMLLVVPTDRRASAKLRTIALRTARRGHEPVDEELAVAVAASAARRLPLATSHPARFSGWCPPSMRLFVVAAEPSDSEAIRGNPC